MIKLPDLFAQKLASEPELNATVRKTFSLFEPWLEQSGMPFFPGFTDHSPRHITDVLQTAASLISDAGHQIISAQDVCVLCMAILLHDSGMHITQDSLRTLITDESTPLVNGLGDLPWSQLWRDFCAEANRFGQEKLVAIFGDATPFRIDELQLDNLSERDCLLIGEFVRRHHARLAHEIAIKGISRNAGTPLQLVGLDQEMRDMSGLVARSHGMPIRATLGYIKDKFGLLPEYRNTRLPFLMAVLRIADYVQVRSERAISALLSVKELKSPVSRQEWLNHFAVKDVSTKHEDPEALYVHANPVDIKTFLKLERLFRDIQRELDETWGTLGEIYGRIDDLAPLGLTIRRIRSNLDNRKKFSATVSYVPINAGFASSGPDLLKLLVGPLYDYEYSVGIREMVQNAVDACRELADINKSNAQKLAATTVSDVTVDIEEADDGTGWISVVDQGVGMTLDTVTQYFLVAGASFRNSDLWKRQHTDESGQSRVVRGGRFGVGALAAFLLGDEITVTTRHFARPSTEGFEFTARIDDALVEIRRCTAAAGTSIKVRVTDRDVFKTLRPHSPPKEIGPNDIFPLDSWKEIDWFAQSKPRVTYRWNGFNTRRNSYPDNSPIRFRAEFNVDRGNVAPLYGDKKSNWFMLSDTAPYKAIYWKYVQPQRSKNSGYVFQPNDEITVNGIRVQKLGEYGRTSSIQLPDDATEVGPEFHLRRPSMAIFDPAGICPINLQRSAVAFERMDVDLRLASAVLRNHLTNLSKYADGVTTLDEFKSLLLKIGKERAISYQGQFSPVSASNKGMFLPSPKYFSELEIESILFVDLSSSTSSIKLKKLLNNNEALMLRHDQLGPQADLAWFRGVMSDDSVLQWYRRGLGLPEVQRTYSLFAMKKSKWQSANEKGKVARHILNSLETQSLSQKHIWVISGDRTAAKAKLPRAKSIYDRLDGNAEIAVWGLTDEQQYATTKSLIQEIWNKKFGGPFLS